MTTGAALAAVDPIRYLPMIGLALALVVAALLAYRVARDLKADPDESLTEADDLLGPLEEAYAKGQMSEPEYLRARDAIVRAGFESNDLKYALRPWVVPPAPAPAEPATEAPPPAEPENGPT
jgi:hypothetical protein